MKLRLFAPLAAAAAFAVLPSASQAGDLGRMHDCMFGWMKHFDHQRSEVRGTVYKTKSVKKVKKAKKVAYAPKK